MPFGSEQEGGKMRAGLGSLLNAGEAASHFLPRCPESGNRRGCSLAREL